MLITFSCRVHEDIVMFGDVGKRLLVMMGYPGAKSGAIQVDELSVVRTRLQHALDMHMEESAVTNDNQDLEEDQVSLKQRAFPLMEMFDLAESNDCIVTWESR